MSEYEVQANKFAEKTGTKLTVLDCDYGWRWGAQRYVFKCRLSRNGKSYTFKFWQSLYNGAKNPTMYDVLACLQKYEVGTFKNFCDEFGYFVTISTERKYRDLYNAVCKEHAAVVRLFGDVIDELREIN